MKRTCLFPNLWVMNAKMVLCLVSSFRYAEGIIQANNLHIYICLNVLLDRWCLLDKFIHQCYKFDYDLCDEVPGLRNWNRVSSWMASGWTNGAFKVLCACCYVRMEPGLWLIVIAWILRPCVAYRANSTKLNYEMFECVTCNLFMSLSFIMCLMVKIWKRRFFVVENNSSHNY